MRQLQKEVPKEGTPPRAKREKPLQEGIMVQRGPGGKRLWKRMGDEEFVEYAKAYVQENGITSRTEAYKKDSSLYFTICSRNLIEAVFEGIEPKYRTYPEDPEEMVAYARRYIQDNGIGSRSELGRKDCGLYAVLCTRGLVDSAFEGTPSKRRTYPEDPEALLAFSRRFIAENGISGRGELQKRDSGLYLVLRRRKLLGSAFQGIARKRRAYPEDPEEFVKLARRCLMEKGITGRGELSKKDSGLNTAIRTRGLLERVFEGIDSKRRSYPKNPEEMVAFARRFIAENGITGRGELEKKDASLCFTLRARGLLDAAFEGIAPKRRTLPKNPEEMVAFAKQFIAENGITGRVDLYRKDGSLYGLLCARKLLDAVFSDLEAETRGAAVQGVLDVLDQMRDS